jgi:hypothetical protein
LQCIGDYYDPWTCGTNHPRPARVHTLVWHDNHTYHDRIELDVSFNRTSDDHTDIYNDNIFANNGECYHNNECAFDNIDCLENNFVQSFFGGHFNVSDGDPDNETPCNIHIDPDNCDSIATARVLSSDSTPYEPPDWIHRVRQECVLQFGYGAVELL